MIYQVCLGQAQKSRLYIHCIQSVKNYCIANNIDHKVLTAPKLKIKPNPFTGERSKESYEKHGGFIPIFEKENVFEHFGNYDQIAVVDADIYIRPDSPNVFDQVDKDFDLAAQYERESPVNQRYQKKLIEYSTGVLNHSVCKKYDWDFSHPNGGEFFNSGMLVYNCENMLSSLGKINPKDFLDRPEFRDFIDGIGPFRWCGDQIMLNYWAKKDKLKVQHLDWKYNALFSALEEGKIEEAHFVHFFMKDRLTNKGENIEDLMRLIGDV